MAVSAPAVMTIFLNSSTAATAAMCQTGAQKSHEQAETYKDSGLRRQLKDPAGAEKSKSQGSGRGYRLLL